MKSRTAHIAGPLATRQKKTLNIKLKNMYKELKIKEIKYEIPPKGVTLIVTNQCTAACSSCCFQCSPKKDEKMDIETAKEYIVNTVESFESISLLVISGGEPFLLGIEFLSSLIEFAKKQNLHTRIVTNGFWAKSLDESKKVLSVLKNSGLNELNLSTGDEHQEFVSIDKVVNASIESVKLGITTVINVESHTNSQFEPQSLYNNKQFYDFFIQNKNMDKLKIICGLWSSLDFAHEKYDYDENKLKILQESKMGCDSIYNTFSIFPDGKMTSCCGLTVNNINELNLGNVHAENIKTLYENQYKNFINLWLRVEGAYKIFDFLISKEPKLKTMELNHACQACSLLFNNELARNTLLENYKEKIPEILFKYNINKKLKII